VMTAGHTHQSAHYPSVYSLVASRSLEVEPPLPAGIDHPPQNLS
jgi:hypothetical protein